MMESQKEGLVTELGKLQQMEKKLDQGAGTGATAGSDGGAVVGVCKRNCTAEEPML